jgi:hypothetical protein
MREFVSDTTKMRVLQIAQLEGLKGFDKSRLRPRFIVLVPAYAELVAFDVLLAQLIESGCSELCFTGPFASSLHDSADAHLEDSGHTDVLTTACLEENEAIEYFLYGAGGRSFDLLALVAELPAFEAALRKEVSVAKDICLGQA